MINAPTALLLVGVLSSGSAFAQIDLSGSWANKIRHENNVEEHAEGDYAGTPINESDRLRGFTWNGSLVTLPCESIEEIVRPAGAVPANLPGNNSSIDDWADHFGIPHEAAIGGAQTMYLGYLIRLRQLMKPAISAQR
jgi:hypothetical protein